MMSDSEFRPVQGESIPVSAKKTLLIVALSLVLIPVGIGLAWLWSSDTAIPLINKQVTWWGALIGAGVAIAGILAIPVVLRTWLIRKERLVIGIEYLQIVMSKGGKDIVIKQIGLRNIESVALQKHFENTVVAIQLRDVDASDLIPAGGEALRKFMKQFGFHVYISDNYQITAEDLCRRIEKAAAA